MIRLHIFGVLCFLGDGLIAGELIEDSYGQLWLACCVLRVLVPCVLSRAIVFVLLLVRLYGCRFDGFRWTDC